MMSTSESPCFDASGSLEVELTTKDTEYIPPCHTENGSRSVSERESSKRPRIAKIKKRRYSCSTCEYHGKSKRALERHINTKTHKNKTRHTCINCNVCKAKAMSDLTKCPLCSYTSKNITSLKLHMNIHNAGRPFKCMFCQYASQNVRDLVQHYKTVKKFSCPKKGCAFTAHVKAHFWEHEKICRR